MGWVTPQYLMVAAPSLTPMNLARRFPCITAWSGWKAPAEPNFIWRSFEPSIVSKPSVYMGAASARLLRILLAPPSREAARTRCGAATMNVSPPWPSAALKTSAAEQLPRIARLGQSGAVDVRCRVEPRLVSPRVRSSFGESVGRTPAAPVRGPASDAGASAPRPSEAVRRARPERTRDRFLPAAEAASVAPQSALRAQAPGCEAVESLGPRRAEVGGGLRRDVERDALTVKGDLSKRISLSMTQPAPHLSSYIAAGLAPSRRAFGHRSAYAKRARRVPVLKAKRFAPFHESASPSQLSA
jgi:hypothetical protein